MPPARSLLDGKGLPAPSLVGSPASAPPPDPDLAMGGVGVDSHTPAQILGHNFLEGYLRGGGMELLGVDPVGAGELDEEVQGHAGGRSLGLAAPSVTEGPRGLDTPRNEDCPPAVTAPTVEGEEAGPVNISERLERGAEAYWRRLNPQVGVGPHSAMTWLELCREAPQVADAYRHAIADILEKMGEVGLEVDVRGAERGQQQPSYTPVHGSMSSAELAGMGLPTVFVDAFLLSQSADGRVVRLAMFERVGDLHVARGVWGMTGAGALTLADGLRAHMGAVAALAARMDGSGGEGSGD